MKEELKRKALEKAANKILKADRKFEQLKERFGKMQSIYKKSNSGSNKKVSD